LIQDGINSPKEPGLTSVSSAREAHEIGGFPMSSTTVARPVARPLPVHVDPEARIGEVFARLLPGRARGARRQFNGFIRPRGVVIRQQRPVAS
jgi:hypothetical protein